MNVFAFTISSNLSGLVVPIIGIIFAGCLNIQLIAIVTGLTSYLFASSFNLSFNFHKLDYLEMFLLPMKLVVHPKLEV